MEFFFFCLFCHCDPMNTCSPGAILDYESRWDLDHMREGPAGGLMADAGAGEWKCLPRIISICFFLAPQVNFGLFVGIIFILVQKLQSPDMGGNESSIYL